MRRQGYRPASRWCSPLHVQYPERVRDRTSEPASVRHHRDHIPFRVQMIVALVVRHGVGRNRCTWLGVAHVAHQVQPPFPLIVLGAVCREAIALADAIRLYSATEENDLPLRRLAESR